MGLPNLIGLRLHEGLNIIKNANMSLNIVIDEYTIPKDFHKEHISKGVKRIVRQRINPNGDLELLISLFNEIPSSIF